MKRAVNMSPKPSLVKASKTPAIGKARGHPKTTSERTETLAATSVFTAIEPEGRGEKVQDRAKAEQENVASERKDSPPASDDVKKEAAHKVVARRKNKVKAVAEDYKSRRPKSSDTTLFLVRVSLRLREAFLCCLVAGNMNTSSPSLKHMLL
ncbi:hypothetical protein OPV22_007868 [Ensete ventricosum]|uniref:Uncharacterized protein n=1 Tax=Ensete ventricosum TaxID=4639 RepID=A0AAV8RBF6_ENSVE|nr:hypothetical protein OPV22_007868 [Ensete ventricosum]